MIKDDELIYDELIDDESADNMVDIQEINELLDDELIDDESADDMVNIVIVTISFIVIVIISALILSL